MPELLEQYDVIVICSYTTAVKNNMMQASSQWRVHIPPPPWPNGPIYVTKM